MFKAVVTKGLPATKAAVKKAAKKNLTKKLEDLKAERNEVKRLSKNKKNYSREEENLDYLIRKEKKKVSKSLNRNRIDKAGERAIVPERVSEVSKETGKFVGKTKKGLKPVNKMTKVEKQDYDFEKFKKGLQRRLIDNVQKGKPAVYDGTDYTSMLNKKRGIKADPAGVSNSTSTSLKSKPSKRKGPKGPVSLGGSAKVGGTAKSKLQEGLESVGKTKSPKVKKTVSKPMSAAKKKRVEEARKKGSGALIREGLSDIKAYGGKVKKNMGGKVGKPKGVGCATRGYGKAMK